MLATFCFSTSPLTVGLSNAQSNPSLAFILIICGSTVTSILLMIIRYRKSLSKLLESRPEARKELQSKVRKKLLGESVDEQTDINGDSTELSVNETARRKNGFLRNNWYLKEEPNIYNKSALIIAIIGTLDWFFFSWALNWINVVVGTLIWETWIIVFVLLCYFHGEKEDKSKDRFSLVGSTRSSSRRSGEKEDKSKDGFSPSSWILLLFTSLGVIYTTLSHANITLSFNIPGLSLLIIATVLSGARYERAQMWAKKMGEKWVKVELEGLKKGVDKAPGETKSRSLNTEKEERKRREEREIKEWEVFFVLLCITIAYISIIILFIIGKIIFVFLGDDWNLSFASTQNSWFTNEVGWLICIVGGLINGLGTWAMREGNLESDALTVNAIYYLTPVLSLIWLISLGLAQLGRWNYFIIGAIIVIATTTLIALETETERKGFRWLIVSLWSAGLLVYFREQWVEWSWLASDLSWEWTIESVDYYSLIFLSVTIFILILSFRTSRLIDRINNEQNQFLEILHLLDQLNKLLPLYTGEQIEQSSKEPNESDSKYQNPLVNSLGKSLKELDESDSANIQKTKKDYDGYFDELYNDQPDNAQTPDKKELTKLFDNLWLKFDKFYLSKQRGRYLAENLVLYIFSLATVMVTIGTRPTVGDNNNWNGFIIDILAFLFSSAISFMTINLIDLRSYREQSTTDALYSKSDKTNQRVVQLISLVISIVVAISFIVLLYDKWIDIWFI